MISARSGRRRTLPYTVRFPVALIGNNVALWFIEFTIQDSQNVDDPNDARPAAP